MFDWNDLRFFIAVARGGSTAAAARELGVDQTTVARRLRSFEQGLDSQLFERHPGGYRLTEAGRAALAQAERVEAEAEAFRTLSLRRRREIEGVIRVTGTEAMVSHLLGPAIYQIRTEHPGLKVEIIVDDLRLDLVRGDADVALRVGSNPTEAGLVGQRMPDSCWAVYCSPEYAAARGQPGSIETLDHHQVIAGDGPMATMANLLWLETVAPRAEVVCRCNTLPNLIAMVQSGVGVSVLPCLVGETSPRLVRCFPPPDELRSPVWLLYSELRREAPHIRVFVDSLARHVRAQRRLLEGAA